MLVNTRDTNGSTFFIWIVIVGFILEINEISYLSSFNLNLIIVHRIISIFSKLKFSWNNNIG